MVTAKKGFIGSGGPDESSNVTASANRKRTGSKREKTKKRGPLESGRPIGLYKGDRNRKGKGTGRRIQY